MSSLPAITLADSNEALAPDEMLSLPTTDLTLMLRLGAHEELDSATLILQGSSSEEMLASLNTTESGPVDNNTWPTENINWIIADWGEERSLVSVYVKGTPGKMRLKVFVNGGWAPLYPGDIININSEQRFPAVVTSKLMLEPVDDGNAYGLFSPKASKITDLTLKAGKQPIDVSLSIGDMPPFFQHAGALPVGQGVAVDDLTAAVNACLAEADNSKAVPLHVHAAAGGEFFIRTFNARAVSVATALEGIAVGDSITLPWGSEASGRIVVGAKKQIREVHFRQRTELADERLSWPVMTPLSQQALLCDPEHAVAQAYTALPQGQVLQGIDLYLRPGRPPDADAEAGISGKLALYPDDKGEPGEQPFAGAEVEFNLTVQQDALLKSYWQAFAVSAPQLSTGPWWAVMTVDKGGELFCYTDVATSMSEYVNKLLYHVAGGGWLPASKAMDSAAIWALSRLRLSGGQSKTTQLALRRGGTVLPISADDDGRVDVSDPAVLARLNKGSALNRKALEIVVTAAGPVQVSGQVTFSDIRVISA